MRARDRLNALKVMPFAILFGYLLTDVLKHGGGMLDAVWRWSGGPARQQRVLRERALQRSPDRELVLDDPPPLSSPPATLDPQPHGSPSRPIAEHATGPGRRRWLPSAPLHARMKPGLCAAPDDAAAAQDRLRTRFRTLDWGDRARSFVDARLPASLDPSLLRELERAERDVGSALGLEPVRPEVFLYSDLDQLRASSCAASDTTAFYDGALHVAVTRRGLRERLQRQYARHALVSRGLVGPSWAREGMALIIARETWWRAPSWLARVASTRIDLEAMERDLPDLLSEAEAQLFYARAAVMCSCAMRDAAGGVQQLLDALEVTQDKGEISYRLPPSAEPSHSQACMAELSR